MAQFQKKPATQPSVHVPVPDEGSAPVKLAPASDGKGGARKLVSVRFIHGVNLGSNGPVSQIAYNSTSITGIAETADGVMIENIGGYTFFVPFSNVNSLQYDKPEAQ